MPSRTLETPALPALRLACPCRLGLISDTHGWLDPQVLQAFDGVDGILHAGDVGQPEVLRALEALAPTVAVRGNIDHGELADLPVAALVQAGEIRIALLHIAGNPNRPNADARALIAASRPDVLLVGHSHIAVAGKVRGMTWINPGAAGHHGFHQARTAFLLEIDTAAAMQLYRVDLGPRGRDRSARDADGRGR